MPDAPLVVCTRLPPGTLTIAGVAAQIRIGPARRLSRAETLDFVAGASVVVTMFSDRVDAEFLDAAGDQLKGVCNFAVGVDNIDLDACRQRGVIVTNTPDAVTEGTADMAWALLLAVARRVVEGDRFVRSGKWAEGGVLGMSEFMGADLTGRTLLVVGAGRIGHAAAMRSIGWGIRVLYVGRRRRWEMELAPLAAQRVSLEEGLPKADVVSLHTPLTPETRGMMNAARIALMKPTAILINTSRGAVIDEAALAEALREGRLAGAGLDVFEREPEIDPGLRDLDNVVMTPHIASAETRYREMMTQMVSENSAAILAGKPPPNQVV
jgi:glyoxylate reductase